MRIRTLALAGAAICTLMPSAVAADGGWYMGLGAGYSAPADLDLPRGATVKLGSTSYAVDKVQADDTWRGIATLGHAWMYEGLGRLRLESEIGYSNPEPNALVVNGQSVPVSGGYLSQITLLGNLLYDLPLTERLALSLGGGIGYGWTTTNTGSGRAESGGFAWQTIAGLSYKLNDQLELATDYRYISITGLHYFGGSIDSRSHNFLVSLRWFFNRADAAPIPQRTAAVPPPPPPAPPPAPPPPVKTYIVFFDFNTSYLTDAAQSVVVEAVKVAKATGMVKVQIAGHTDTVGPDDYNMKLSLARAASVKEEMAREGMEASSIAIEGKGFHDPLVPTGPGVREPQNRRAVIDLGS